MPTEAQLSLLKAASPIEPPIKVGKVGLLISTGLNNGYCVVVDSITSDVATVHYLDSAPGEEEFEVDLWTIVPSDKSPDDLLKRFVPTDASLTKALDFERSLPDFTKLPTKSKSKPKKSLAEELVGLSVEDKKALGELLKMMLKK
jgi:hypothetical protein